MKAFFFLSLLFLFSFPLFAQNEASLTVGYSTVPYDPYVIQNDASVSGIIPDLIHLFALSERSRLITEIFPLNRLNLIYYTSESIQLRFPDNPNWNRQLKKPGRIFYSRYSIPFQEGLVILDSYKNRIRKVKTVATLRGFTVWPYMQDIQEGKIILMEAENIKGLIEMLIYHRVDAVYLNPEVASWHMKRMQSPYKTILHPEYTAVNSSYHFSSYDEKLINRLDLFIEENPDRLQMLIKKYIGF